MRCDARPFRYLNGRTLIERLSSASTAKAATLAFLGLAIAGCSHPARYSAPPRLAAKAPPKPATTPDSNSGTKIEEKVAGPFRIGMPAGELSKLPDMRVQKVPLPGTGNPKQFGLQLSQFGAPMALAELSDGKVSRVRIFSNRFRTSAGARINTRARQLEKMYGKGTTSYEGGTICARFAKAPGLGFYFYPVGPLRNVRQMPWDKLVSLDAGVQSIQISGSANAGNERKNAPKSE